MITFWFLINFVFFTQYAVCRDFYMGYMYHPNATLVAQDVIYKAPPPFGFATATYGRLFKCQISFFRVVDRLGIGRGPFTKVVRGGIGKKFIAVRIKATHKLPISVNIYVACVKKQKPKKAILKLPEKDIQNMTNIHISLISDEKDTTDNNNIEKSTMGGDNIETSASDNEITSGVTNLDTTSTTDDNNGGSTNDNNKETDSDAPSTTDITTAADG